MAWLQSSFTNHQLIGESGGNNLRKGYKVGSLNKNTDPDHSDTPLLHDGPVLSPKNESAKSDWFDDTNVAGSKKPNILHSITSKPSFLSSSFFDRSSGNMKPKSLAGPHNSSQAASGFINKSKEDKKLLSFNKNAKPQVEEDADDDSEDDWFSPHASGGYQRVRTGAD